MAPPNNIHPAFYFHNRMLDAVNESKGNLLDALSQFFVLVYQNKYTVCDNFFLTPVHLSVTVRIGDEDYMDPGKTVDLMIPLKLITQFTPEAAEAVRAHIKESAQIELADRRASLLRAIEQIEQEMAKNAQT